MSKANLISQIKQVFLDNDLQGETLSLEVVGRNFETSTGEEEGEIEIISISETEFFYRPAGHSDEFDGDFNDLSEEDLNEILHGLEDVVADLEKGYERAGMFDDEYDNEEEGEDLEEDWGD